MNTKNDQILTGEMILGVIDLYNIECEKLRVNLMQRGGHVLNVGKILTKEPFNEFYNTLQIRDSEVDIDWFIENLSRLRIWGTFCNIQNAEDAIEDFKKLQIEIPKYVMNCYNEIDWRTMYINSLIDDNEHKWNDNDITKFDTSLNKEFQAYAFDKDSKIKYLTMLFNETITKLKETESKVKNEYSYSIDRFYDGETFIATKEDLNMFFFNCEKEKRTINVFDNLLYILRNYINNRNKLKEIKKRIEEFKQPSKKTDPIKQPKSEEVEDEVEVEPSPTKTKIMNEFETMEGGWEYAFTSKEDYITLVDLLTNHFENKPHTLPKSIIELKRNCKTKIGEILNLIHKELSGGKSLKDDHDFIDIIKILNHFENSPDNKIYKAIAR